MPVVVGFTVAVAAVPAVVATNNRHRRNRPFRPSRTWKHRTVCRSGSVSATMAMRARCPTLTSTVRSSTRTISSTTPTWTSTVPTDCTSVRSSGSYRNGYPR
uniref:Putative secreted peptide n=1 Tax=Anopheles braziliensis TaxID=58242 RepID=A0A2M3ZQY0_9DIPT